MKDTGKINTEIEVMKNELQNIKETNVETKLQNTAEHVQIIKRLDSFDTKLDNAISCKADKSDLQTLDSRFWAVVMAIIVAFIGIIVTAIKSWGGKISAGKKGQLVGESNPNWKGGVTHYGHLVRLSKRYQEWRIAVLERDGWKCRLCGEINTEQLHVHHSIPLSVMLK